MDDFLRQALLLANSPQVLGLDRDPAPPPLSRGFHRRMAKLLADPKGYARRYRRPLWRKALRTAACVALAAAVTLGAVLAVSPAAREWVSRLVVEWFDVSAEFRLEGSSFEGETVAWRPGWVLEGYEVVYTEDGHEDGAVDYQNEIGTSVRFRYTYVGEDRYFNVDNEHGAYEEVTVNGAAAHLIRSHTPGWPSHLSWTGEEGTVAFLLSGEVPAEDLLRMAQSVAPAEE